MLTPHSGCIPCGARASSVSPAEVSPVLVSLHCASYGGAQKGILHHCTSTVSWLVLHRKHAAWRELCNVCSTLVSPLHGRVSLLHACWVVCCVQSILVYRCGQDRCKATDTSTSDVSAVLLAQSHLQYQNCLTWKTAAILASIPPRHMPVCCHAMSGGMPCNSTTALMKSYVNV